MYFELSALKPQTHSQDAGHASHGYRVRVFWSEGGWGIGEKKSIDKNNYTDSLAIDCVDRALLSCNAMGCIHYAKSKLRPLVFTNEIM